MRALLMLTMVLMILGLSGCETMEGLGKDVKSLGESIEKKASSSNESNE